MTIEEVKDSLFPDQRQRRGVRFSKEGQWESVRYSTSPGGVQYVCMVTVCVCVVCVCVCVCRSSARICGISVTVPDFYPILKYLEHSQRRPRPPGSTHSTPQSHAHPTVSSEGAWQALLSSLGRCRASLRSALKPRWRARDHMTHRGSHMTVWQSLAAVAVSIEWWTLT